MGFNLDRTVKFHFLTHFRNFFTSFYNFLVFQILPKQKLLRCLETVLRKIFGLQEEEVVGGWTGPQIRSAITYSLHEILLE